MRVHTVLIFQMTDSGLTLLKEEGYEYCGPIAKCDRSQAKATNKQALGDASQDQSNAQGALSATNTALGQYSSNLSNYMTGANKTFGANGDMMNTENTLANSTAAAGTGALKGNLALNATRTGANTANYANTVAQSQRQSGQAVTNQLAQANLSRLQQLNQAQQFGVQASAVPAQIQAGIYGSSTSGANGALGSAAQSAQVPGFVDSLTTSLIGAGGAVGAGFAGGTAQPQIPGNQDVALQPPPMPGFQPGNQNA
jgi:hypothetical protein